MWHWVVRLVTSSFTIFDGSFRVGDLVIKVKSGEELPQGSEVDVVHAL